MRPERLKILGRRWEIEFKPGGEPLGIDEIGCSDSEKQLITIKDGLKPDQERSTALHEVLHGISEMLGLGLTEKQVQGLETGLFSVLRDNARFVSYLRRK